MATYTVAELKDLTSVKTVSTWSDAKILLYQSTAESLLGVMGLDSSMDGYAEMYNSAIIHLFDWFADNPTNLSSMRAGKAAKGWFDGLPPMIRTILQPYIDGAEGTFTGAVIQRSEIGLN